MNNIQSGRHYELIALDYLITLGFIFIEKNFHDPSW